jgi:hypothetical protein
MSETLPPHTLMVTYLDDVIWKRKVTLEHLADLMCPVPEATVRSWAAGWSTPSVAELIPLAAALHITPVEMTAAWLIDNNPELESALRNAVLEPLGSSFPKSDHYALRAPRPRTAMPDLTVGDPHDERYPVVREFVPGRARVLKRSAAVRKREGEP